MDKMIKMIAVDMDGTFLRSDQTYDTARFMRALGRMRKAGCRFVVASGNQYYQLRDFFPGCCDELSFVAENGAFVKDGQEVIFSADMPKETVRLAIEVCDEYPEIRNVMCGVTSAYCQRGKVSREFFELTGLYYHRLKWVDDLRDVSDRILKFAPTVPEEKTDEYHKMFQERLGGRLEAVSSGHGSIDLIVPGCHKASGLARLAERFGISPKQCAAFGDGGNDIEMLEYCRYSFAVENAPENVKNAAKYICPSNDRDGVLAVIDQIFP